MRDKNAKERAGSAGYLCVLLRQSDVLTELVEDFSAGREPTWPLVSASLLSKVWGDFVTDGYVRDERALDGIFANIRDNLARLQIANIVSGHERDDPHNYLSDHRMRPAKSS